MAGRRNVSAAVLAAALVFSAASCGGDGDPTARPTPTDSATTSATPTPTATSPTVDPDAWRAEFTEQQLTQYDRAVAAWTQYGDLLDKYHREPVDRDTAQRLFERYTHRAAALTDSYQLSYIDGGVRQVSAPTRLGVEARKIAVDPQGSLVEFDQCMDYTTLDIRRNGAPIEGAAPTKNDTAIVRVQMASDAAGAWRVFTSKVVDRECA